jgi:MYXO-CTERM domain-containing protein
MTRSIIIGLVLVDLPFLICVAVLGSVYGYRDVANAYLDFGGHPVTMLMSLILVAGFVVWRRRRA